MFEERYIRRKCALNSTYDKGEDIYYEGGVIIDSDMPAELREDMSFWGRVKGSGNKKYRCDMDIKYSYKTEQYEIRACSCECEAFQTYSGICKHLVAMTFELEEIYKYDEYEAPPNDYLRNLSIFKENIRKQESSSALLQAMEGVRLDERSKFCQSVADGDVKLYPILHLEANSEKLDFKIGREHLYVVKNVEELASNIRKQKYVKYGKNFEFAHTQSSFTKESQRLVNMILENTKNIDDMPFFIYDTRPAAEKRYLELTPAMLDDLFEMYEGKNIETISCTNGYPKMISVKRENPSIKVEIKGDENIANIFVDYLFVLEGVKKMYVYYEDIIYIVSDDYSENMKNILKMIRSNYSLEERKINRGNYFISSIKPLTRLLLTKEDYASFTHTLLNIMEKYMDVYIYGVDFSEYQMEEGVFSLYFDVMKEINAVVCRAEAAYGDKRHNLMTPASLKETYRDIRTEYEVRTLLEQYMPENMGHSIGYMIVNDDDRLAELIEYGIDKLREFADIYASDEFKKLKIKKNVKVNTGLSIKGHLLDVSWDVEGMKSEEIADILDAYKNKKKYYKLKNGELLNIYNSGFDVLSDMISDLNITKTELKDGMAEIPLYRALYLESLMNENAHIIKTTRDENFKKLMDDFDTIKSKEYVLSDKINAELRPYQMEGFKWANTLSEMNFGGILADDMGLGKTLQMISFISSKREGTSLVVAPASLVYNWGQEFEKFAPEMKVALVADVASERTKIIKDYLNYDVLVTSYDLLKRDIAEYEGKKFWCQIIDEAQYIKNPSTQGAKAVKAIDSKVRFALTGTPIENRLSELWSIFEYLMPGYLYSYKHFKEVFEEKIMNLEAASPSEKTAVSRLHQMISPFLLRRLKKDVLEDLPDKVEKVIYSKFEKEQDNIYKASEKKIIDTLNSKKDDEIKKDKLLILAELTKLRQICCDPHLLFDNYKGSSSKLETCMEIVEDAIEGGHKVLLFSQFTSMLEIIEKRLNENKIRTFSLTGQTSKLKRRDLVARFQNGEADVFLISLKAGGTGLNLTEADFVIHYDPWWNQAAQNQATDRAHRIGQKNTVTEIKIIAKGTIEERILKLQQMKKDLADKIISEDNVSMSSMSKDELMELFS